MSRLLSLLSLSVAGLALAGCEMTMPGDSADQAGPVVPPEVTAALPAGVPPSIVFQTADGCYAYSIEVTDPPSGYRLRDRNGNVVCPPGSVPVDAPAEAAAS